MLRFIFSAAEKLGAYVYLLLFVCALFCAISRMARKVLIDGELDKSNEEETHYYDFDLFVIGAGSGGVRASRFSAQYGAKVDDYSRTNIPSIWAIGDVTNRMNLTPVALMEGTCFAKTVFGGQPTAPDYSHIPCAVFCIPQLSVVGLSEEQALENANGDVLFFTSTFNPMKKTVSGRQEKTVMKLVVDAETDKVLGASMCGPDAPEIMQGIAIALKCGATKAQFDGTVGIHPSAAEEFVTMRSVTRRIPARKPKTNL